MRERERRYHSVEYTASPNLDSSRNVKGLHPQSELIIVGHGVVGPKSFVLSKVGSPTIISPS